MNYGKVPRHPPWDTVFLVGGGTSVPLDFDFGRLRPHKIVVVNDSLKRLPQADAFVSIDVQWLENRRNVLDEFNGEKYFGALPGQNVDVSEDVCVLRTHPGADGLSRDPEFVNVHGNSGYAALNVAYLRGARKIFLMGYDFYRAGEHWFGKYEWQGIPNPGLYYNWAQAFSPAAVQLYRDKIEVWNVGMGSLIPCFPKISYDSLWSYV